MKRLLTILFFLIACSTLATYAQENTSWRIAVDQIEAVSTPDGQSLLQASYRDEGFHALPCLNTFEGNALPIVQRLLQVPLGTTPHITVTHDEPQQYTLSQLGINTPLASTLPATFKSGTAIRNNYTSPPLLQVETLGIMGDRQLLRVTVAPFEYDTISQLITVHHNLTLAIEGLDASASERVSFTSKSNSTLLTSVPPHMVVVVPQEWRHSLQPWLDWKRQQGYRITIYHPDTAQCDTIRDYLKHLYLQGTTLHPAPQYVTLIGDIDHIPAFPTRHTPSGLTPSITDLYYGEYTDDYLPESMVGRIPVHDTTQLKTVVQKLLQYEQYKFPDPQYLNHVLVGAGTESGTPAPTTTNGQVNYVKGLMLQANSNLDTHCFYNPSTEELMPTLVQTITQGNSVINYTGHCDATGWLRPNITIDDYDTLDTTARPTFYVNNCCKSNNFSNNCFGEQLLRLPHSGAVGVIGATNETLWNEDYHWSVGAKYPFSLSPQYDASLLGAFDRLLHPHGETIDQQAHTAGQLLQAGNFAVTQFGSPYDKYYWEIYCLLGDPTLMPYVGVPQPITLAVDILPTAGATQIALHGTPHTYVAAMQHDTLLGCTTLDAQGQALLQLQLPATEGPLSLTSTLQQHYVRVDTLTIAAAIEARLCVMQHTLTDDATLQIVVKNIGPYAACRHTATLQCPDTLLTTTLDTLLPQATDTLSFALPITTPASPYCTTLLLADSATTYSQLPICYAPPYQLPSLLSLQFLENDGEVTTLRNGTSYTLRLVVDNPTPFTAQCRQADTLWGINPHHTDTLQTTITMPDSGHHFALPITLTCNTWQHTDSTYLILDQATEDFESGTLSAFPWDLSHIRPWIIDSNTYHSGHYSVRSAPIADRQTSELRLHLKLPMADSLSFWIRTSTEINYDKATFYIDGVQKNSWSGGGNWRYASHLLTPGHHTLTWRYTKDDDNHLGSDCVWLDDLSLPLALWDSTYGYFPADTTQLSTSAPQLSTLNSQLSIYPNPASHQFSIATNSNSPTRVTLYDACGRQVDQFLFTGTTQYSTTHLRLGIYTLQIDSPTTHTIKKIIIAR